MHTSAGAACDRDDDGAPELYMCHSLRISKVNESRHPVNDKEKQNLKSHASEFPV